MYVQAPCIRAAIMSVCHCIFTSWPSFIKAAIPLRFFSIIPVRLHEAWVAYSGLSGYVVIESMVLCPRKELKQGLMAFLYCSLCVACHILTACIPSAEECFLSRQQYPIHVCFQQGNHQYSLHGATCMLIELSNTVINMVRRKTTLAINQSQPDQMRGTRLIGQTSLKTRPSN